jgi:Tol biopolymer transport system component
LAIDATSGEQKVVFTSGDKYRGAIRLSPDGRWVAATAEGAPGEPVSLMLIPASGGKPKHVASIPTTQTGVDCFSPDGKFIFLRKAAVGAAPVELVRVDIESGQVHPTGLRAPNMLTVQLTPDGRQIVYQAGTREVEIWMADNVLPAGR